MEAMSDWVGARAKCSVAVVFENLRNGARRDVHTRNEQLPDRSNYVFRFAELPNTTDSFSVIREGGRGTGADIVRFSWSAQTIEIESQSGRVNMRATLTLNLKGECRLLVNNEELEEWHVRKKALEGLFFDSPS